MYEKSEKYVVKVLPHKGYEVIGYWQDDIHRLKSRIVFEYKTNKIIAAEVEAEKTPFPICTQGIQSIKNLIGKQVSPGFYNVVKANVMNKDGCIHVGELVLGSVKAAIQAASREMPEWVEEEDYKARWAVFSSIYKDKCIFFAQPDAETKALQMLHECGKNKGE
ncbi:Protein of unknown function [Thermosyntropha lipolytica DSM 11003]|uniref:DUF2889 domain-containing protein n=1 Tax=Thermosyntropha lipolytica DSM 11003 TaxID=1123382 RepID=A0A1M5P8U6_9FIRM|nr:DUF2889 domain-containing protein [Thermosyntropha lipolytica]SHG98198.1 Protein of unknown function [Thermosyntropha lipolytica DSM 11003]